MTLEEIVKEYHLPRDYQIIYDKHKDGFFRMKYPEPFMKHFDRFMEFFQLIEKTEFTQIQNELIIMISHGNSMEVFLGLTEQDYRKKMVLGVNYCNISIAKKTNS